MTQQIRKTSGVFRFPETIISILMLAYVIFSIAMAYFRRVFRKMLPSNSTDRRKPKPLSRDHSPASGRH